MGNICYLKKLTSNQLQTPIQNNKKMSINLPKFAQIHHNLTKNLTESCQIKHIPLKNPLKIAQKINKISQFSKKIPLFTQNPKKLARPLQQDRCKQDKSLNHYLLNLNINNWAFAHHRLRGLT